MHGFIPILGEVSDKEPTVPELWCVAAVLSVGGFLLCRWRRSAGWAALGLAVMVAWGRWEEIHSPDVGPAILEELGQGYVATTWIASLIPMGIIPLGFLRRKCRAAGKG